MDEPTARRADLYSRPAVDDPTVAGLLGRLGVAEARDLGGTMSLNLHLGALDMVMRVHPRFETATRVHALRSLRGGLHERGLIVGVPKRVLGDEVTVIDGYLAEGETYVRAEKPDASWEAYVWMYAAMGALHRAINAGSLGLDLPEPDVATYATPDQLRRWIRGTSLAVRADRRASALAAQVTSMVEDLERQWTPSELLPQQVVHGDIRLGNVARTADGDAAFFDFGFAARRPRIHELAYSLFWIVLKPDDNGRAEDFDWARAAELLEAYEEGADDRLGAIERRALGPYLAAIPMYLAAIASYAPDPSDRIKQETRSLEIARWVLDHPDHVVP